jgi:hypothetical protein
MMKVNDAINYLEKLKSMDGMTRNHKKKLTQIINLFKRLPQTKDFERVLPGDELEERDDQNYLLDGMPYVEMRAYFILQSGQHVVDSIENYNYKKGQNKNG